MTASDDQPLLPTITSRCQLIPFAPLSLDDAAEVIRKITPETSPEQARTLASLTNGCPGRAKSLHSDEVLTLYNDCLQSIQAVPGLSMAESVEQSLALAARAAELKDGLDTLFDLLAINFKDSMVAQLCAAGEEVVLIREDWNLGQLSAKVDAIDAARRELARNCNRVLVCEVLLLDLFA